MSEGPQVDLKELGERVERARRGRGLSKEAAAREAGISSITWKRVEDGLAVQDAKLEQVLRVVGIGQEEPGGPVSRDGLTAWLSSSRAALHQYMRGRDDAGRATGDLVELISGAFEAAEIAVHLGVDIESANQLLNAAMDIGLATGVVPLLSAATPEAYTRFMAQHDRISDLIAERRRAGELGRPSYIRTTLERGLRDGRREMARTMSEKLRADGVPAQRVAQHLLAFFSLEELEATGDSDLEAAARDLLGLPRASGVGTEEPAESRASVRVGTGSGKSASLVAELEGEVRKTPDVADSSTSYWESERSTGNVEADLPLASRKGLSKGRQARADQDAAGEENQDSGGDE